MFKKITCVNMDSFSDTSLSSTSLEIFPINPFTSQNPPLVNPSTNLTPLALNASTNDVHSKGPTILKDRLDRVGCIPYIWAWNFPQLCNVGLISV